MFRPIQLFILLLLFLGCAREVDYKTLTIAYSADIRGFDPAFATDRRTGKIISLVYDNLVRFDADMNLTPAIAHNWSVNNTGRIYTFYIRNNVRFHDGSLLTINDIITSFHRVLDPQTSSPQTWLLERITGAKDFMSGKANHVRGLQISNDSSLVVELDEAFAPFIQYMAMPATAIINSNGIELLSTVPAGSGPWQLETWARDGELLFNRNKDYWDTPPTTDNLRIRILSEVMTQSAEFETGSLDILEVPQGEIKYWSKYNFNQLEVEELNIWYIGMNCSRPPFDDLRLRQAMNYSIDREKIIHILLNGSAALASGPVPPQLLSEATELRYEYNPSLAIQLLQEAGFGNGLKTEIHVAGGSGMFHVLEALQSDWAAVGITVEIKRSDWNVFKTAVREGKPDLYYLDWFADYPDGENFLYPLFYSTESMKNRNRFSDPDIDAIIVKIQRLPNNAERQRLIADANKLIVDAAPWVFLWHSKTIYLTQQWIKDFQPSPIFNANRYMNISKMEPE